MTSPLLQAPATAPRRQWWRSRFLWVWHGTFATVGVVLLALGAWHGVVFLVGTVISFALMTTGLVANSRTEAWVAQQYPAAHFWKPVTIVAGSVVHGEPEPTKDTAALMVVHPGGVELVGAKSRQRLDLFTWSQLEGASASSDAVGSTPVDCLTLFLPGDRTVALRSFDTSSRWPERTILARPADQPWPQP